MKNLHNKIAIFATSLLVTSAAVYMYSPVLGSNAADSSSDVNVEVNPIISLSLDTNALNFTMIPTSAGVFDSKPIVATVDTNSTGGYELYFSSIDDETAMTSLTSESTITSTFTDTVTSTTMTNNTWGYSPDNTDFSKIPTLTNHVTLKNLDHLPSVAEKQTTTNIGIKIDNTLASGTYNKKVLFSAVAHQNREPVLTIHSITSMQQMTPEVCANTTTPVNTATIFDWDGSHHDDTSYVPRNSLRDDRDGKYYLVSKLADGECWMSQNLELMLDSANPLTSATTDLNTIASWTPENSTTSENVWPNTNEAASIAAYSYYPTAPERYYKGGKEKSSTPTASGVEYDWEKAGVYYNWFAATAGTGTFEMTSGDAEDSICPKGWRLPYGDQSKYSFYRLIYRAYGIRNGYEGGDSMIGSPLNFTRSGLYSYGLNSIYNSTSTNGFYWASNVCNPGYCRANRNKSAQSLYFNDGYIYTQYQDMEKGIGLSVRCVAR